MVKRGNSNSRGKEKNFAGINKKGGALIAGGG